MRAIQVEQMRHRGAGQQILRDVVVLFTRSHKVLLRQFGLNQRAREARRIKLLEEVKNIEVGALHELDLRHLQLPLIVDQANQLAILCKDAGHDVRRSWLGCL